MLCTHQGSSAFGAQRSRSAPPLHPLGIRPLRQFKNASCTEKGGLGMRGSIACSPTRLRGSSLFVHRCAGSASKGKQSGRCAPNTRPSDALGRTGKQACNARTAYLVIWAQHSHLPFTHARGRSRGTKSLLEARDTQAQRPRGPRPRSPEPRPSPEPRARPRPHFRQQSQRQRQRQTPAAGRP
jgi:hypothetical protein